MRSGSDEEDEKYAYSDEEEEDEGWRSPRKKGLLDGTYALIDRKEVEESMLKKTREVSELLDVPSCTAEVLLRHTGWSSERLMEKFWVDPEKLREACGVENWTNVEEAVEVERASSPVTCRICFSEVSEVLRAPCGHAFCAECYEGYLANKVDEGSACVLTTCPSEKCSTLVPPQLWSTAVGRDELEKYQRYRIDNFISFSKNLRWCPAPKCGRIVQAGSGAASVRCGPGGCGFWFCMKCGEEAHQPASCQLMMKWSEKCQNESETANWILANTKRCPKCQTRIEKNQGCNHMVCSQCKFDFCWVCLGDWAEHSAATGGYYKCNKYDPQKASNEDESDTARAKRELDRYLHYYKRYHGHEEAQKFAVKQLEATEKRMVELQESTHGSWIDVQFLKSANEMVIDCRRVLKSTYIFGYYLDPQATIQRELFENLQEHLERFTETLSEMTEQQLDTMDRSEVVNITRVTESFLNNLIAGAENGLDVDANTSSSPSFHSAAPALDAKSST